MTCRIIFSGPICTWKSTIINQLTEDFKEIGLKKLEVHTTRKMREGERQGYPYTFINQEDFKRNESEGRYFDVIDFNGNFYAVLKSDLDKEIWLLDILSTSWKAYKSQVPDAIGVYLKPPKAEILRERAQKRHDKPEAIRQRIEAINSESPDGFDYQVEDFDDYDTKYQTVKQIVHERIAKMFRKKDL